MQRLHAWLGNLKVHKSHYSRGQNPLWQYLDYGLNTTKLHNLYVYHAMENEYDPVKLKVFKNVFNNVYNITTRYVLRIIWSYTVQIFVYKNTLKLRSTNSKNNYIKLLHKIITPLLSLIITFKATQDRCVWQVQRVWQ